MQHHYPRPFTVPPFMLADNRACVPFSKPRRVCEQAIVTIPSTPAALRHSCMGASSCSHSMASSLQMGR